MPKNAFHVLVSDERQDDCAFARLPIDRRGHSIFRGQLKSVDNAQDFIETAPVRRRIRQNQLDPFRGREDGHIADGLGLAELGPMSEMRGVEHAEEHRDFAVLVRDDRKVDLRTLRLVDVRDPPFVIRRAVYAQANDLDPALASLRLRPGGRAQLRRAYRRDVSRM